MLYKNDICFCTKNIVSKKVEVIFVDLLLPKTKPISVDIFYRPPKDTNFLQLFAEILNFLNILENEMFVLGDTNINSYIEKLYRILLNSGVKTTN